MEMMKMKMKMQKMQKLKKRKVVNHQGMGEHLQYEINLFFRLFKILLHCTYMVGHVLNTTKYVCYFCFRRSPRKRKSRKD